MIELRRFGARIGGFSLGPIELQAPRGAYLALVGPSGHGKSSLLWALAGATPHDGQLRVGDRSWDELAPNERSVAIAPQNAELFPHLTVAQNIGYGLPRGSDRVGELARTWGIGHLLERWPSTLSGGEAMRVAIARALAREPELLLLDEPLGSIDEAGRQPLIAILRGLKGTRTIVHVTHDLDEAASLATHLGVLREGKLVAFGEVDEILLRPPTPEVAAFLGLENMLAGSFAPHGEDASLFATGGITLHVLARATGSGYLSVPERGVILARHAPTELSARNTIPGTIASITTDRSGARVELVGAVRLFARLERESVAALRLEVGGPAVAIVKAAQLRVVSSGG